jgi:monovalent cation:H+ antiporter-2, CPA2 family
MVVALSMAVTPLLANIVGRFQKAMVVQDNKEAIEQIAHETHDFTGHVILAGFGRVGKTVASVLEKQGVPYVVLDMDVRHVKDASKAGLPVFFGDAGRPELLEAVGAERAICGVIALDNPKIVRRALHTFKHHFPHLKVVVRATNHDDGHDLVAHGADAAVPESMSSSIQLGKAVLDIYEQGRV